MSRICKNPYLQLFVAVVLIGSSLMETFGTISEDFTNLRVRVFHGTLLLGLMHFFRTLPEAVEGMERLTRASGGEAE